MGLRRHHRLRRPRCHRPRAHRAGRRAPPRPAVGVGRLRRADARHEAVGRRHLAPGRGAPDRPRAARARPVRGRAARRRGRAARLLPGLPLLPAPRCRAPGGRALQRPRPASRAAGRARRTGARPVRPDPAGRAAVPADLGDGDGQGGRGLRVLPLLPPHLAQRGRRRPVGLLDDGHRVPRGDGRPAARLAGRDDDAVDPRHQAQRGRSGAHRGAGRGARAVGADPGHAARRRAAAGPGLRQPALAGGVRRLADLARAAARVRREGDARGRRPDHVDRPGRGLRERRARRGRRRLRRRGGAADPRVPRRRPVGRRPLERARREAAVADRPRRAGRLPGQRAR